MAARFVHIMYTFNLREKANVLEADNFIIFIVFLAIKTLLTSILLPS